MGKRQIIGGFFFFGFSIANLIYVCRIFNETKEDPFNTVLLDKKSYFYNVTQLYQKIEKSQEFANVFATDLNCFFKKRQKALDRWRKIVYNCKVSCARFPKTGLATNCSAPRRGGEKWQKFE